MLWVTMKVLEKHHINAFQLQNTRKKVSFSAGEKISYVHC